MPALRADAARSRELILTAARAHDRHTLRLNDVARDAGVGVGTVYRHFPTVHALVEALSLDTLRHLEERTRQALAHEDIGVAVREFLRATLTLQLEDSGLQDVLVSSDDESDETRALKRALMEGFEAVVDKARSAGVVDASLTVAQLQHLVCGIEHAVRLGRPADRDVFLRVILDGIAPRPSVTE